jgi:hypothetical protein
MWGLAVTCASEKTKEPMAAGPAAEGRQRERGERKIEWPFGNRTAHIVPPALRAAGHVSFDAGRPSIALVFQV